MSLACEDMESILRSHHFVVFEQVQDLGFFSWTPKGGYKKLHQVSASELKHSIDFGGTPPQVREVIELQRQCPITLKKVKTTSTRNEYPYHPSYLVPLYVAVIDRNVEISHLHFVFGGSVLDTLAGAKIEDGVEYWAQQVPGTKVVVVEKHQSYTKNWNDFGPRFERFVWGVENEATLEHLQTMVINGHNILVSAECDGVDQHGTPVEIKASNPHNWGTKVAFQMISNGSRTLYLGQKSNNTRSGGAKLQSVRQLSLNYILEKAFKDRQTTRQLEKRLRDALDVLAKASADGMFDDSRIFTLHFVNNQLSLQPLSLLPTESVVHELLHTHPI